ncbi:MAG: nitroreductase family protein [Acidimicrobiales bacterium]
MEFQDVLRRRRMVRDFRDDPIPAAVTERIVANAARAPSAGHTQGWAFLVLEGPEQTGRFWRATGAAAPEGGTGPTDANLPWPGLLRAPLVVVVWSHRSAYVARYSEPDKAAGPEAAHRDPDRWPTPWWHVDAGFAALIMLLTAVDADLGALFFGVFAVEAVRREFGVPGAFDPIGAVAIGYPGPADRPSHSAGRGWRPLQEVVHRGDW